MSACRSPATAPSEDDAGEVDAGLVDDAGVEEDAGVEPPDAGVEQDAGVVEPPDAGVVEPPDAGVEPVDLDQDGLPDDWEAQAARDYLPFLSLDPQDACPVGGIAFRVSPHPRNPALVYVLYDHLFDTDCGLGGHAGDNEAFGVTIDPLREGPTGITAIVAISHQGTLCQRITRCGACNGLPACELGEKDGIPFPVVYSSKDKHGGYVLKDEPLASCNSGSCLDTCVLAPSSRPVEMVNVGEPNVHVVRNLTADGFITVENGWTHQELFNFNPWDPSRDFGGAGNIASDLTDMSFVPEPCYAP